MRFWSALRKQLDFARKPVVIFVKQFVSLSLWVTSKAAIPTSINVREKLHIGTERRQVLTKSQSNGIYRCIRPISSKEIYVLKTFFFLASSLSVLYHHLRVHKFVAYRLHILNSMTGTNFLFNRQNLRFPNIHFMQIYQSFSLPSLTKIDMS